MKISDIAIKTIYEPKIVFTDHNDFLMELVVEKDLFKMRKLTFSIPY